MQLGSVTRELKRLVVVVQRFLVINFAPHPLRMALGGWSMVEKTVEKYKSRISRYQEDSSPDQVVRLWSSFWPLLAVPTFSDL